jgi:hypothetical protein
MSRLQDEPERNSCRPVDGPDGQTEYIFTVPDGRGIQHYHGLGGCPFGTGGLYFGRAEELLTEMAGEPCADCGEVHW